MLLLPTKGFSRSVKAHNVRIDIMSDWIEASVLLVDEQLSETDIVDVLMEEEVYQDQDFAREMVDDCWAELVRRQRWLDAAYPWQLDTRRICRRQPWQESPAYAFCLILSLARHYDWWTDAFGYDYTEQGEMFEHLARMSLESQFSEWIVHQTGWSRTNTAQLSDVVEEVARRVGGTVGDLSLWNTRNAKELGLDLLAYRPFADGRAGIPVYLIQCASGGNWQSKRQEPLIEIWRRLVLFGASPCRGFAIPFLLDDDEFRRSAQLVDGLLRDRIRLLLAATGNDCWLPVQLAARICRWLDTRVESLLQRSN